MIALSYGRRARANGIAVPVRPAIAAASWWRRLTAWARFTFAAYGEQEHLRGGWR